MPSLKMSKYSFVLIIGIASAHFLLAAGFMLYFFHVPAAVAAPIAAPVAEAAKEIVHRSVENVVKNVTG